MKKAITFLYLFTILVSVKGQSYIPFPADNSIWSEYFRAPYLTSLTSYYYRNIISNIDTTIGVKSYHQLFYSLTDTMFSENSSLRYNGGIRESNQQVFYLPKDSSNEYLLYDFSLQLGDSLKYDYSIFSYNYGLGKIDSLRVSKVDSVLVYDGTYRKRLYFTPICCPNSTPYIWTSWIEGIGNNMGLLCPISDMPTNNINYTLGCLKVNEEKVYYNNLFQTCYPENVGVFEYSMQNDILISPNPVQSKTTITFNTPENSSVIYIYDMLGKLVFEKSHLGNINTEEIDLSELPKGMYCMIIKADNGIFQKTKLIKL